MSVIDPRTTKRNDDNEIANQSNPQLATGSGALTSGRSATFSSGTPQTQGSGRFTSLQKYINANQGASEQMANRVNTTENRAYGDLSQDFNKKNQEIQTAFNQGKNLIENQGSQFKNQLSNYSTGLGSFQDMYNRGTFDQTGQDIQSFVGSPQFADFQKLQSGQAINQQELQKSQDLASQMNQSILANIQNKSKNLQTESGKYDLLRNARPKFGDYSSGQARLDQLFFQANPNALNQVRQTYQNQLSDIGQKNTALTSQNQALQNLYSQNTDLANALQSGSVGLQNTFYDKLNADIVKQQVNAARQNLFNDYLGQLGILGAPHPAGAPYNISSDLADLLNLRGIDTYSPTENGTRTSPVNNTLDENQFRLYNTMNNPNAANYLTAGRQAQTFQDVLNQPSYDTFNALNTLSGKADTRATGVSNLGGAVIGSDALRNDISLADTQFRNALNQPFTSTYGHGGDYVTTAYGDLNDYLLSGNPVDRIETNWDQAMNLPGTQDMLNYLQNNLRTQLEGKIYESGVGNVATIGDDITTDQEKYKRFKGLI